MNTAYYYTTSNGIEVCDERKEAKRFNESMKEAERKAEERKRLAKRRAKANARKKRIESIKFGIVFGGSTFCLMFGMIAHYCLTISY